MVIDDFFYFPKSHLGSLHAYGSLWSWVSLPVQYLNHYTCNIHMQHTHTRTHTICYVSLDIPCMVRWYLSRYWKCFSAEGCLYLNNPIDTSIILCGGIGKDWKTNKWKWEDFFYIYTYSCCQLGRDFHMQSWHSPFRQDILRIAFQLFSK